MSTTIIDVTAVAPVTHHEAMLLQAEELGLTARVLRTLDDRDWEAATDCPGWDVRAMYQHVLGACEAGASLRENVHQLRRARAWRRRHGGPLEAALTSVQVSERLDLSGPEVATRLSEVAPKTVHGRSRLPAMVRRRARLKVDGPVFETWTLGYLLDVIYLRDLWMHRVDLHEALGRPLVTSTGHDGRIVADVVAEWARRHGKPFVLELTGPAGGTFAAGARRPNAERVSMDAVMFCRTLAGRLPGTGVLATPVPF
jgi:uncharacterized protein (TIGR03083 family)